MPRSLPLASLLLPLLLLALPAAAGGGHASSAMHSSAMHAAHMHGFHVGHFHNFQRFAGSSFFAPLAWGWDDWDGAPSAVGGQPMVMVLNLAPPAPPAAAAAAPRSSITKEAGVTVIRGPGTHH